MKKFNVLQIIAITMMIALSACDENDDVTQHNGKTTVQFKASETTLSENGASTLVKFKLNPAAFSDGQIVIKATGDVSTIRTTPEMIDGAITIPVEKGDTVLSLNIKPLNNSTADGNKQVVLNISSVSEKLIAGAQSATKINLTDDETDPSSDTPAVVQFASADENVVETNAEGISVKLSLSKPAAEAGRIDVSFSYDPTNDSKFELIPTNTHNYLTIQVEKGASEVSFTLRPKNDVIITGDMRVQFEISVVSAGLKKGTNTSKLLTIKDDELSGKPKGYVTGAPNDYYEKWYTYDGKGRIKEIKWKLVNPFTSEGVDTYIYNEKDQVITIMKSGSTLVNYTWEGDRVTTSEKIVNGVVKEYSEYDYDESGHVAGSVTYHRNANGSYSKGFTIVYLYFTDGNIYKSMIYSQTEGSDDLYLVATRTYENYINHENPFPMVEIIPGFTTQTKLPGTYTYEQNDDRLEYPLSYEFNDMNQLTKRSTTGGESTTYYYY